MGERTDRAIRSLRARVSGKSTALLSVGSIGAVLAFAVAQGWVAVGWETTAHAAQTYETRENAANTYETKAAADRAHLHLQASIAIIEHDHAEQMRTIRSLQRDLVRLLVTLGVQPTRGDDE